MLFYVIFHLYAGRTEKLMKRSNIVRKMLKQGWMLKSQDFSTFSELRISSWLMLFVGKLHNAHLFQIDSDLVLSNVTPATQRSRSSWIRLGPRSRRWSKVCWHCQVYCQNPTGIEPSTPWTNWFSASSLEAVTIRDQTSSELTSHRLAIWTRQPTGSEAGTDGQKKSKFILCGIGRS